VYSRHDSAQAALLGPIPSAGSTNFTCNWSG
jgi:hypothetical protein